MQQLSSRKQLTNFINRHLNQLAPSDLQPVSALLLEKYADALQAIVYYGSCLRSNNPYDGLIDLYVLVDQYAKAYPKKPVAAFANWALPPNVFYLETGTGEQTIRVKYALLSISDFEKATSPAWFHSYIWGRFSQPSRLLYARNAQIKQRLVAALVQAHITFISRVVPAINEQFDSETLWSKGLALSYKTELRPEKPDRSLELYRADQAYYDALTEPLLKSIDIEIETVADAQTQHYQSKLTKQQRQIAAMLWTIRRIQGKLLSITRLIKALFTFQGGVDYIAWKIERHSGVNIEVTDKLRKFPLIYGWGILWKLHRQGVLRS